MQLFLSQPRYLCAGRLFGSIRAARQGRAAALAAWHLGKGQRPSLSVWDRKRGREA